jgi:hypothetical protein
MVKLFYKDEYATIELDDEVPCVKLTLQGVPRFSEHYQLVQVKRLELMHREIGNFEILHMLTDSRAAGPVLNEDVDFFKLNILPEMERVGIRYLAVVMPIGKLTRMTVQEMVADANTTEVKTFDDMRQARAWLKSKTAVMN